MPRKQAKRGSRSGRTGASRRSSASTAAAQAALIARLEAELRQAKEALRSRPAKKAAKKAAKKSAVRAPAKKVAKKAAKKSSPKRAATKRFNVETSLPRRDARGRFISSKRRPAPRPAAPRPAAPRPAAPRPAARPAKRAAAAERKVYRDENGRFISRAEFERTSEMRRIEREFQEKQRAEQEMRRLLYPIDGALYMRLSKVIGKVARAIEDSNLDLSTLRQQEAYGSLFDATVDVSGLEPLDDLTDLRDLANKEGVIESAILAAYEVIEKAGVKRGFQVQLQLQPKESIMLQYKRDRPIMSTRWMRMDDRTEIDKLSVRARELLNALAKNDWDTRHIKFSFRYDREVAVKG